MNNKYSGWASRAHHEHPWLEYSENVCSHRETTSSAARDLDPQAFWIHAVLLVVFLQSAMSQAVPPVLSVQPSRALVDEKFSVQVENLPPGCPVTVRSLYQSEDKDFWEAYGHYVSDHRGTVSGQSSFKPSWSLIRIKICASRLSWSICGGGTHNDQDLVFEVEASSDGKHG